MGTDAGRSARAGFALPLALLGLIVVTVLVNGIWSAARVNGMAARNREDATQALSLAEAGVDHALGLLRGPLRDTTVGRLLLGADGLEGTDDDGLLVGYELPEEDVIADTGVVLGRGRYQVSLVDDPADGDGDLLTDSNFRLLVRCTGRTRSGAVSTVHAVVGKRTLPAIASEGDLRINGNPEILGPCGGAHSNASIELTGTPTVATSVSASDTVEVSGRINGADGSEVRPRHHQPEIDIPDLDPMSYCDDADYILYRNGFFVTVEPARDSVDATGDPVNGWKRSGADPTTWDLSGNEASPGTYCVEGSVTVSGNPQGPGSSAIAMTILATGSVEFSGNPKIDAAHPDGLLIIAGGDLSISGNPSGWTENYGGTMYSESQCRISGNPSLAGQMLCKDKANPPGTVDGVSENVINGNPEITYGCGGMGAGRRSIVAWYPVIGG